MVPSVHTKLYKSPTLESVDQRTPAPDWLNRYELQIHLNINGQGLMDTTKSLQLTNRLMVRVFLPFCFLLTKLLAYDSQISVLPSDARVEWNYFCL